MEISVSCNKYDNFGICMLTFSNPTELGELIKESPIWRTRYAIGVCEFLAKGPFGEPEEKTKLQQAICTALMWQKDPSKFDEEYAKRYFGEEIWEKAKRTVSQI